MSVIPETVVDALNELVRELVGDIDDDAVEIRDATVAAADLDAEEVLDSVSTALAVCCGDCKAVGDELPHTVAVSDAESTDD